MHLRSTKPVLILATALLASSLGACGSNETDANNCEQVTAQYEESSSPSNSIEMNEHANLVLDNERCFTPSEIEHANTLIETLTPNLDDRAKFQDMGLLD